jgi:hypothetical protein
MVRLQRQPPTSLLRNAEQYLGHPQLTPPKEYSTHPVTRSNTAVCYTPSNASPAKPKTRHCKEGRETAGLIHRQGSFIDWATHRQGPHIDWTDTALGVTAAPDPGDIALAQCCTIPLWPLYLPPPDASTPCLTQQLDPQPHPLVPPWYTIMCSFSRSCPPMVPTTTRPQPDHNLVTTTTRPLSRHNPSYTKITPPYGEFG